MGSKICPHRLGVVACGSVGIHSMVSNPDRKTASPSFVASEGSMEARRGWVVGPAQNKSERAGRMTPNIEAFEGMRAPYVAPVPPPTKDLPPEVVGRSSSWKWRPPFSTPKHYLQPTFERGTQGSRKSLETHSVTSR